MALRREGGATRAYHPVPLDSIAKAVQEAVTTGEDARFWTHHGIDYVELRATLGYRYPTFDWGSRRDRVELWRAVGKTWGKRDALRGASTITQQLAKNLYLSPSKNPLRKLRELIIARRLEAELKKARILELYLNVIEWGDGIYGAEAAAQAYFHQPASTLSPVQSALLAGAIVNPRLLNPAHPTPRLLRRQQLILRRMGAVSPPPAESAPPVEPVEPPRTEGTSSSN